MPVQKYPASPAIGISEILKNAGTYGTWTHKIGRMVDQPNRLVVLMDTGGVSAEAGMNIDYPTIQVLVRGDAAADGYSISYAKACDVRDALLGIPSKPAMFPELTSCTQRGHITSMGYDDKDRPLWSLNFQLITEPLIAGYREVL